MYHGDDDCEADGVDDQLDEISGGSGVEVGVVAAGAELVVAMVEDTV